MATIELSGRSASDRATPTAQVLTRAAMAAGAAPSAFSTQPWRWRIVGDIVELRADRTRQLATTDPDGRLLTLSCGAALHHLRIVLDGTGWSYEVTREPDPADADLFARVRLTGQVAVDPLAVRRQQAIVLRRTDRRPFADVEVPAPLLDGLRMAAESEGAHLHLLRPDQMITLAALGGQAAAVEFADARYRSELDDWTNRPPASGDGVPAEPADRFGRYAVLFTGADDRGAWLAAGEALSAVLLTAAIERLAVSPMSDVVEVPATRQRLRELLGGIGYPALALRIGMPADAPARAAAPRRPAAETISEVGR